LIPSKNLSEIKIMQEGGKILRETLLYLESRAVAGMSLLEIDRLASDFILKNNAKPSFLGYENFPKSICTSVNDVVVHGIPNEYTLKDGDIISVDAGVFYKGFHTDSAITFSIGKIDKGARALIDVTKQALAGSIGLIRPGIRLGDISFFIQDYVEKRGFGIVRELVGHGIGRKIHEPPQIPNYGKKGSGIMLNEGMVLAIEPMVTEGDYHIKMSDDGWGIETKDGKLAAHFEHTIAVVKNGSIILT